MEQLELSCFADKNVNWYNTLENCLAESTKAEHMHNLWPRNFIAWHISKYVYVYSPNDIF